MKNDDIIRALIRNKISVATAESCTGGLIASEIVSHSGVSSIFEEGYITYSEGAKSRLIGVNPETIKTYGVVSHPVAMEMAASVRRCAGSDIGIATTGVAGPNGGDANHPVGTVFIACSIGTKTITRKYHFHGTRTMIRNAATQKAFQLLRECLIMAQLLK